MVLKCIYDDFAGSNRLFINNSSPLFIVRQAPESSRSCLLLFAASGGCEMFSLKSQQRTTVRCCDPDRRRFISSFRGKFILPSFRITCPQLGLLAPPIFVAGTE